MAMHVCNSTQNPHPLANCWLDITNAGRLQASYHGLHCSSLLDIHSVNMEPTISIISTFSSSVSFSSMQHRKKLAPTPEYPAKIVRPLYELSNYFVLSRILYYVPYQSPIHPGRVLSTFGALSSIIEALNANGAAYVANSSLSKSKQNTGKTLLKVALCLQLGVLGCFVLLAASFHRNCKKANILPSNLRAALTTLYISSALIGVRTIYRTAEYFSTSSLNFSDPDIALSSITPMMRYEWFFWVFEASLMVINSCLLNARHPMRYLPRNNKIYLAEDGQTEILGAGYEDKRSFLVTFLDPFDLWGMLRGKSLGQKFWETHAEGRVVAGEPVVDSSRDQAGEAEKGRVGRRWGLIALIRNKQ
jgi:hypothetical protein